MQQLNLTSTEVFDRYLQQLSETEDLLFRELMKIEKIDKETVNEWNDINHANFTQIQLKEIQKTMLAATTAYYDSISKLNDLKKLYLQIL